MSRQEISIYDNVLQCDGFNAILLNACDVVIIYDRFLGEREAFDHWILDYMETELQLKYKMDINAHWGQQENSNRFW